jgi:iron complex transport system permease protein
MTGTHFGPLSDGATSRATASGNSTTVSRRARRRRLAWLLAILAGLILLLMAAALMLGKASLSPSEIVAALTGNGSPKAEFVIGELRLPRILTALVVGASLGISGSVFQTTLRNPLASPDIIGITASASAVGIIGIVVLGLGGFALTIVVVAGSLAAATLMYLLAWREGLSAFRLVLIGIGVAAICSGVVSFVLSRSDIRDAQSALVWITGSLNASSWAALAPMAVCATIVTTVIALLTRPVHILELGDDTAAGLGVPVERIRLVVIACAVALAAIAVSTTGPLAFIALAAGQIGRRALGAGTSGVAVAGFVGAAVLLGADLVAQFALPETVFPTGVVTGLVGAPFLIWLLIRASRTGSES